jgi:hypothetical protein
MGGTELTLRGIEQHEVFILPLLLFQWQFIVVNSPFRSEAGPSLRSGRQQKKKGGEPLSSPPWSFSNDNQ